LASQDPIDELIQGDLGTLTTKKWQAPTPPLSNSMGQNKDWNQNKLFQMARPTINTLTVPTLQLNPQKHPMATKDRKFTNAELQP